MFIFQKRVKTLFFSCWMKCCFRMETAEGRAERKKKKPGILKKKNWSNFLIIMLIAGKYPKGICYFKRYKMICGYENIIMKPITLCTDFRK